MSKYGYIDADKLMDFANNQIGGIDSNVIARFPKADVVEVVRCKNCRLRGTDRCPMYYEEVIGYEGDYGPDDTIIHHWSKDDDFCSCGEREEDE